MSPTLTIYRENFMFTKISPPTVNDVNVYLSTQKGGGRGEVGGGGGREGVPD